MLTRLLSLSVLLTVVTVGCSSSSTQGASRGAHPSLGPSAAVPSVKTRPSAVPTPTATPFTTSADEAGARAFVAAYMREWDRALATGDTSRMATYRIDSCVCVKGERTIKATYTAGGIIVGGKLTILRWAFGAHGPAFARTAIAFHATTMTYKTPGKRDVIDRALYGDYLIDLRRAGEHWIISDIRFKEVAAP
jgi:hypothetical protein